MLISVVVMMKKKGGEMTALNRELRKERRSLARLPTLQNEENKLVVWFQPYWCTDRLGHTIMDPFTLLLNILILTCFQDTGGKKQRAKKDPNAPKKPLSAYMLWLQENRASFKEKYPGITVTEIGKKAGEMWKQISKEDKQVCV